MAWYWWIVIALIIPIIFGGIRAASNKNKVYDFNQRTAEIDDNFILLSGKVLEHESFKIIGQKDEMQVIEFDHKALIPEINFNNNINLEKNELKKLLNFILDMIDNNQFPLIKLNNDFIIYLEQDEQIGTGLVSGEKKEEFLNTLLNDEVF